MSEFIFGQLVFIITFKLYRWYSRRKRELELDRWEKKMKALWE